jgi:hypothetical protein
MTCATFSPSANALLSFAGVSPIKCNILLGLKFKPVYASSLRLTRGNHSHKKLPNNEYCHTHLAGADDMHPITARFLSFSSSKKALLLLQKGMPIDSEELCFDEAAKSRPELAKLILESKSSKPEGVQRALFWLSLKAALVSLKKDLTFVSAFSETESALLAEGATPEQMESLFLSCLFEEAFESEHDFSEFDAAFVLESIQTLSHLTSLSEDKLEELRLDFEKHTKIISASALSAFNAFFNEFFEEGLEVPSGKHMEALYGLFPSIEETELNAFLDFLEVQKMIGPLRKQKLVSAALQTKEALQQA